MRLWYIECSLFFRINKSFIWDELPFLSKLYINFFSYSIFPHRIVQWGGRLCTSFLRQPFSVRMRLWRMHMYPSYALKLSFLSNEWNMLYFQATICLNQIIFPKDFNRSKIMGIKFLTYFWLGDASSWIIGWLMF